MKNSKRLRKGDIIRHKDGLYFVVTDLHRRLGYVLGREIINNVQCKHDIIIKTSDFTKIQCVYIMLSVKNMMINVTKNRRYKIHMMVLPKTKQSKKLFKIDNSKTCIVKFFTKRYSPQYVRVVNVRRSLCFENQLFLTYEDI